MSLHSMRPMCATRTGRPRTAPPRGERIDWPTVRDRTDLAAVATALLGPPAKRVGSRLAWCCPFHDDHNPSFTVDERGWRCWTCGIGGDAAALVMRHRGIEFPEAARWLADLAGVAPSVAPARPVRPGPSDRPRPPARPSVGPSVRPPVATAAGPPVRAAESPPDRPSGLDRQEAERLAEDASERLWTPEGAEALAYLRGRGLTEATIRRHRLGWTRGTMVPRRDDAGYRRAASGVVIPWYDGDRLALVQIRRIDGREPRYDQIFTDRPRVYPGPEAILPGMLLIAVEGAFEAMILGQELEGLASVITTGSSSTRLDDSLLPALLCCPGWFAAHDADDAGDGAAAKWPPRTVRVRPPVDRPAGKDWGDARQAGIDLRCWWLENVLTDAFDREERAAIMEYDGGLSREDAECAAGLRPSKEGEASPHTGGVEPSYPEDEA